MTIATNVDQLADQIDYLPICTVAVVPGAVLPNLQERVNTSFPVEPKNHFGRHIRDISNNLLEHGPYNSFSEI
jgi:hypothetical protein